MGQTLPTPQTDNSSQAAWTGPRARLYPQFCGQKKIMNLAFLVVHIFFCQLSLECTPYTLHIFTKKDVIMILQLIYLHCSRQAHKGSSSIIRINCSLQLTLDTYSEYRFLTRPTDNFISDLIGFSLGSPMLKLQQCSKSLDHPILLQQSMFKKFQ